MAEGDKEALNLYQIIGAPLLAVVQAETQAAQVSAAFIKQIGFQGTDGSATTTPEKPLQEGGNFGDLRMAQFKQAVRAKDGSVRNQTVNIPVLSLFPIPLLQVKNAEFDFAIRILDHQSKGPQIASRSSAVSEGAPAGLQDFLSQNRVELKGKIARDGGPGHGERTSEMSVRVKVRMEQADIPAGLARLLQIADGTIHAVDEAPTGAPEASPAEAK